ncbi:MAG: hypothetical protein E7233_03815 [Lachnospiraceae bacterium]|nr:hypothetical protein [Lachnospiraceae bacterium]
MATELGNAYVQIMPSAKGIGKSTGNLLNEELSGVGSSAGEGIGKNLIKGIKNIIIAAGIGKVLKDTIMEGARLEQSLGGVEAIFGEETAKKVQANAKAAFATAGVSANEYMEGVTSFAAALLESTGKDTEKAADIADLAFRDMSDNANRFGTDIGSIQNAYQGFAKQNYTMLDNLKLGYGGTKQEMERLLENAQKISGVEYNIDNLADVYEAIHVIQGELNVTGTTAAEAATTFSGSLGMMKAAAKNLMGSVAFGEDIGPALKALTSSVLSFSTNAIRLVGNVIQNIPTLLKGALENISTIFSGFKFSGLVGSFYTTVSELVNVILTSGPQILTAVVNMLTGLVPNLIEAAAHVLKDTAQNVAIQIPEMMADLLPRILEFTQRLKESVGDFIDAGITLLGGVINGIIASIPDLLANIPLIITNIADLVNENIPKLIKAGLTMIVNLAKGLWDNRHEIMNNLGNILTAIISVVQAVNWLGLGKQIITFIGNGLKALITHLPDILKGIGKKAVEVVKGINWLQLGKDIINGIVNGIRNAGSLIKDMLMSLASSALSAVKSFLGIGSPSRVFAEEVGQWIPAGIATGIEDNAKIITGAMDDIVDLTTGSITSDIAFETSAQRMRLNNGDMAMSSMENAIDKIAGAAREPIVINVYASQGMDEETLVQKIKRELIETENRRRLAWG